MVEAEHLRVVLVGGSGFLGRGLRARLVADGHTVDVVSRQPAAVHDGWQVVSWDASSVGPWSVCLEDSDVVVHLADERVDTRPTKANIERLISSREQTVQLVATAMRDLDRPPQAWVQLSSLSIFGDGGDDVITEATTLPTSGLPQQVGVCKRREAAYREATTDIGRSVLLRPSFGIGGDGDPATKRLTRLARLGLGGKIGSGHQWVSWLAARDFFDLLVRAVVDAEMSGLYHLTATNPVRNDELMAAYRNAVGINFGLPSPTPATKLGAWLLGSDPALALTGRCCVPARLLDEGYSFRTTDISEAVQAAVSAL